MRSATEFGLVDEVLTFFYGFAPTEGLDDRWADLAACLLFDAVKASIVRDLAPYTTQARPSADWLFSYPVRSFWQQKAKQMISPSVRQSVAFKHFRQKEILELGLCEIPGIMGGGTIRALLDAGTIERDYKIIAQQEGTQCRISLPQDGHEYGVLVFRDGQTRAFTSVYRPLVLPAIDLRGAITLFRRVIGVEGPESYSYVVAAWRAPDDLNGHERDSEDDHLRGRRVLIVDDSDDVHDHVHSLVPKCRLKDADSPGMARDLIGRRVRALERFSSARMPRSNVRLSQGLLASGGQHGHGGDLAARPYDAVVSDINMPAGSPSGVAFIQWLRTRFPNMPVIVHSDDLLHCFQVREVGAIVAPKYGGWGRQRTVREPLRVILHHVLSEQRRETH